MQLSTAVIMSVGDVHSVFFSVFCSALNILLQSSTCPKTVLINSVKRSQHPSPPDWSGVWFGVCYQSAMV